MISSIITVTIVIVVSQFDTIFTVGASSATSGSVAASQKTVPVGMFLLSPHYIHACNNFIL